MFGLLSKSQDGGLSHAGRRSAPYDRIESEAAAAKPNPELMLVTPTQAAQWLKTVPSYQRRIKARKIEAFTRDMMAGKWKLTHQGIAFDEDGGLADGQNRLHAVVKSGVAVRMYVFRGLGRDAIQQVDTGKSRTIADALKVGGARQAGEVHVAIAQMMMAAHGWGAKTPTASEVQDFMDAHPAIDFGVDVFSGRSAKRGITSAPVRAAIVAACENHPTRCDDLRRFCRILYDGIPDDRDRDLAAVKLRDVLQLYGIGQNAGKAARVELYRRSQRAIKAFLDGQPLSKIYSPQAFIFVPKGINT